MKRTILATALLATLLATALAGPAGAGAKPRTPQGFFGIGPQGALSAEDLAYMRAGGVESIRVGVSWSASQQTRGGGYDWTGLDNVVATATRARIGVLPFLYQTPGWLARDWRTLPVSNARQRSAWRAFLRAIVKRYGPGGQFWAERRPGVAAPADAITNPLPIRTWQIWNEANFFYFAWPVVPARYAKLAMISSGAIKSVDRGAKVILSGLFGEPDQKGRRGMDADDFLAALYRKRGLKSRFDGIALHPYAVNARVLRRMVESIAAVAKRNRDRPELYLTEFGWGSEQNFKQVAFEQGPRGQVRQLRNSYRYLVRNHRRLNLKGTYWFSWKDLPESCNFCDSVGLFHAGEGFRPKPAWRAFVRVTGGRVRP